MSRRMAVVVSVVAVFVLLTLVGVWFYVRDIAPYVVQANGFAAKTYCSSRYVSGREASDIYATELARPELNLIAISEDADNRIVRAGVTLGGRFNGVGLLSSAAVYRPGLGCTIAVGVDPEELSRHLIDSPNMRLDMPWQQPLTDMPSRPNAAAQAYVRAQFERGVGTRALLVWHRGNLVAEQYGDGIESTTPLIGWSMAKSVTHALLGIAVREGWVDIEEQGLLPQWQDHRAAISVDDLVRMSSGLEFDETYDPGHDPTAMLFAASSTAAFAADKPLEAEPGSEWKYSSGTTNILAALVTDRARTHTGLSPAQFADRYLFSPLGTRSFVVEPDTVGNLIGSSFAWATARDWLRFGLLYMNDGVWQGQRILPAGWATYAASMTDGSDGAYGAHFWINGKPETGGPRPMPSLPADTLYASGFEGQDVVVIPSQDLVVVRLGFTPSEAVWDLETHLPELLRALNP